MDKLTEALSEKLHNKSVIEITVQTQFKPQIANGGDCKEEIIKRFHDAVFKVIESYLTENEELEQSIMEELQGDWLPEKTLEFSDLGEISISISEGSCEVKQKDLDEEDVKFYLQGIKKPELSKYQTRLNSIQITDKRRKVKLMRKIRCTIKKCAAWRACGCIQNLEPICKRWLRSSVSQDDKRRKVTDK